MFFSFNKLYNVYPVMLTLTKYTSVKAQSLKNVVKILDYNVVNFFKVILKHLTLEKDTYEWPQYMNTKTDSSVLLMRNIAWYIRI